MEHRLAYTIEESIEARIFTSRRMAYEAIRRGDIDSIKNGKRRMITHEAALRYLRMMEKRTAEGRA